MAAIKGKKGQILSMAEKNKVLEILEKFLLILNKTKAVLACSETTGRSPRTIYQLAKEKSQGFLRPPKRVKKPHIKSHMRILKYKGDIRSAIRRIIHSCILNNIYPHLNTILESLNTLNLFPPLKRGTLYNLLKDIGFEFSHPGRSGFFLERQDIIAGRHEYLKIVKAARKSGKTIIYTGEMWIDMREIWHNSRENMEIPSESPFETYPFLVVIQAGTSKGFIPGTKLTLLSKTDKSDPQNAVSSNVYEDWFFNTLIPNCPSNSVIVLDESRCHCGKVDLPFESWSKQQIIEWLNEKEVEVDSMLSTEELLRIVTDLKDDYAPYKIDMECEKAGFQVLRLPPDHPELNPITVVWEDIEIYMKSKHNLCDKKDVLRLINKAYKTVKRDVWKKACKEGKKNENLFWVLDCLQVDVDGLMTRFKYNLSSIVSNLPYLTSETNDNASVSPVLEIQSALPLSPSPSTNVTH